MNSHVDIRSDVLTPLVVTDAEKQAEYKARNKAFKEKRVTLAQADKENSKWSPFGKVKKGMVNLHRDWTGWEKLENRVWSLLHNLGYDELSSGDKFCLPPTGMPGSKQCDVFAKDDIAAIVVECKYTEKPTDSEFKDAISALGKRKKEIGEALRIHYGKSFNPKVVTILATQNYRMSSGDVEAARDSGVKLINEDVLSYMEDVAFHIGYGAKPQFMSVVMGPDKIPSLTGRSVNAIRLKVGGRWAFMFTATAEWLHPISFISHTRMQDSGDGPTYQRMMTRPRLEAIKLFINSDGYFANSILMNFASRPKFERAEKSEKNDKFDTSTQFGTLFLPDRLQSCFVIDGQHRLVGSAMSDRAKTMQIPVIAFECADRDLERTLFSTINKEQKQVTSKHMGELEGDLNWNSKDPAKRLKAIAARAITSLRSQPNGVLSDKIASAEEKNAKGKLSLPEMQRWIVASGLLGRVASDKGSDERYLSTGALTRGAQIETMRNFVAFLDFMFTSIKSSNPSFWLSREYGAPASNVSFAAYLKLVSWLIPHIQSTKGLETPASAATLYASLKPYLQIVEAAFDKKTGEDCLTLLGPIPYGGEGQKHLALKLASIVHKGCPSFNPDGLEKFCTENDTDKVDLTKKLADEASQTGSSILKNILFSEPNNALQDIVGDQVLKTLINRRLASKSRHENLGEYLDIEDLPKVMKTDRGQELLKDKLGFTTKLSSGRGINKLTSWVSLVKKAVRRDKVSFSEIEIHCISEINKHLTNAYLEA